MTKKILVALTISVFFTSFILINGSSKKQPTSKSIVKIVDKKKTDKVVKKVIKKPVVKKVEVVKKKEVKIAKVIKKNKKVVKKQPERETINILISYYTNSVSDCGKTDAVSASGKTLSRGGDGTTYIAAPSNIPFRTRLNIRGIGICSVVDRGGAIHYTYINGTRYMKIDVFVPGASNSELENKGIMKTKGYIIK